MDGHTAARAITLSCQWQTAQKANVFSLAQSGVTITSVQPVTITQAVPAGEGQSGGTGSTGLSTGAKAGIGGGVGGGVAALLLLAAGFWYWRRRKNRVDDNFKWPELGDGTGSGGTAAGLFPNATHPTGDNRFDMDDEELYNDGTTTQNGHSQMMSERDPSFLSSAGYSAGMAGMGAGAGAAAAGAGAAAAGRSAYGGSDRGDYYSQDGHNSPPQSSYGGHNNAGYGGGGGYGDQQPYGNYYNGGGGGGNSMPMQQSYGGLPSGAAPAAAGAGAGAAAGYGLGRSGSIASTAANNYQVGPMGDYDDEDGRNVNDAGRQRNPRNRLSVVNNLDDVEE